MCEKISSYIIILFVGILLVSFNEHEKINPTTYKILHKTTCSTHKTTQKPIILIHDVSPKYFSQLKAIVKVIDKNHYQNRSYLFLIVNHANKYNLENYPKFVNYLHYLENNGYHIEYHAYNHIGDEFDCNKSVAEEKLNESFEILNTCGFNTSNIKYFIPPRYKLSKGAEDVFLNRNITIIMDYYMLEKENSTIKKIIITNKEYTWYLPKNMTKEMEVMALLDYKVSQHPFYLSIHPKAVNYGGGLDFLNYFLNNTNIEYNRDKN